MNFAASLCAAALPFSCCLHGQALAPQNTTPRQLDVPSGKRLQLPSAGAPQRLNSLPMTLAVSPDGRYVASLNAGYGTFESHYMQSIALLDTQTGTLRDVPESHTAADARQTLWEGLTWSADGQHLYASLSTMGGEERRRDAAAPKPVSGVLEYTLSGGSLAFVRLLPLPPVTLAAGHLTDLGHDEPTGEGTTKGIVYPAGLAYFQPAGSAGGHLLVAENLTDRVVDLDLASGTVAHTFDLTESATVPGTYPLDVAITRDGRRAFVSLWNASEVAELDLSTGTVVRRLAMMKPTLNTAPGSHPCAMQLDEADRRLYVALSNRDTVAAVEIGTSAAPRLTLSGAFDTRLPGQTRFGAEPDALAYDVAAHMLYAGNMGTDSVAIFDTRKLKPIGKGLTEPAGFAPAEEMPMALAFAHGKLYVANGRGQGTGPNGMPQRMDDQTRAFRARRGFTYAPTLDYGSLQSFDAGTLAAAPRAGTEQVLAVNRMQAAAQTIAFAHRGNPIHHVIYIIKENRTYDQVFGDLPVGNNDKSLVMYGQATTPNLHRLALQFGVLDNFYDSGEVSGEGHVWSTAAIGTDYLEKTWQQSYRNGQRSYDYEGMVANGLPLTQGIPDVNEAQSGYLWTDLAAHGKSLYHFGEYIASSFCTDREHRAPRADKASPQAGAMSADETVCASPDIKPGEALPAEWGGGVNLWPWAIPRLASNRATKPELVGHFAPESPDFNLRVPDQVRVDIFLKHLAQWKQDLAAGHDTMPAFVMLRLPNDHTGGTAPGGPTPSASVADNDLAVGRAVEAISHSGFWDSTAFFILEDDAQNGGDHVDAHRSLGLVISKYSPHAPAASAGFVDSHFYSTVSFLRTMEMLLGVPPMNNNDAFAPVPASLFSGPGDQPAFTADTSNRDNKLIYTANKPSAPGAAASAHMDFRHADQADTHKLNIILWQDARGNAPVPTMLLQQKKARKDDDD